MTPLRRVRLGQTPNVPRFLLEVLAGSGFSMAPASRSTIETCRRMPARHCASATTHDEQHIILSHGAPSRMTYGCLRIHSRRGASLRNRRQREYGKVRSTTWSSPSRHALGCPSPTRDGVGDDLYSPPGVLASAMRPPPCCSSIVRSRARTGSGSASSSMYSSAAVSSMISPPTTVWRTTRMWRMR